MSADDWQGWRDASRRMYERARWLLRQDERPCVDYPASWAAEQRAAGRCNGEPECS